MEEFNSKGKCLFCDQEFSKSGMTRHLTTHLSKEVAGGKPGRSYHLKVETGSNWGKTPYFLHLWVDGSCTFDQIDHFLRAIWLECCGHMSAFRIPQNASGRGGDFDVIDAYELLEEGKVKEYEKAMKQATGQIPMENTVESVAEKGLKIKYEYDFGSSTLLEIAIVNEYAIAAPEVLILLSRNEPHAFPCTTCKKKAATDICTVCNWNEVADFCSECAKKHAKECADFDDYAAMTMVNSPRTGVCGYEGGSIDLERDQINKLSQNHSSG